MVVEIAQKLGLRLSAREQQILELIAYGDSAKQVARNIGIAPLTVERHVENIRAKFHAQNTAHMINQAYMNGLLKVV